MTKAIAHTINSTEIYRHYAIVALLFACVLTAGIYIYNVYVLISRTVALQHASQQIATLDGAVNALDAHYLDLSSAITPDTVKSYGMSEGQVSLYINRPVALGRVAMRGHEF